MRVERSGAERVFQRIGQEMESGIHAVDVVNSADGAHFIVWKRNDWLAPYLPEEVARLFAEQYFDAVVLWVTTRVFSILARRPGALHPPDRHLPQRTGSRDGLS